jgi:hypothetical protein
MNTSAGNADAPEKILRRLFLTLFLRGRSSRGLKKEKAPKSVGEKLSLTLLYYTAFGFLSLFLIRQPVFALSVWLHAMTFVFLGMFVASSAGEVLFNGEEGDILLYRPISPKTLLWAKIRVLVEVSLWLAGAFNLSGLFVGIAASNGDWRFPLVHAFSTILEAMFCTGCVVLVYQLCLRWFGRERLDGLMTTAQVLVSMAAVLSGQILPQLLVRENHAMTLSVKSWWMLVLPPAWFAGFDDALAGSAIGGSWVLAALAVMATLVVLLLAFGKLASDYGTGLQALAEVVPRKAGRRTSRRWLDRLTELPPLRWWLRDQVERASFLLAGAYLVRDRDVKLRIYPAIAPILVLPFIFLIQDLGRGSHSIGGFGIALAGGYLGMIPLMGLTILQYSQQWQASDVFRAAPMLGPGALFNGARRAIVCFMALPVIGGFGLIILLVNRDPSQLLLLLPGVIALPVFTLVPGLGGKGVPLSLPTEEAKSTSRGLAMMGAIIASMVLAGLVAWAWYGGWFWWLVLGETIIAAGLYLAMRRSISKARWSSLLE